MSESQIANLQQAVEGLHDCKATFKEKTHVIETFEGNNAWEGDIYIFDLEEHPNAKIAYAWSSPIGAGQRKFYAVLHIPPVESAQNAVRASIARDYRDDLID